MRDGIARAPGRRPPYTGCPSSPLIALIRGETRRANPNGLAQLEGDVCNDRFNRMVLCSAYTYSDSYFKFEIVQNKKYSNSKLFKTNNVQIQNCSKPKMFTTENVQI
jgi:hypothetical protein